MGFGASAAGGGGKCLVQQRSTATPAHGAIRNLPAHAVQARMMLRAASLRAVHTEEDNWFDPSIAHTRTAWSEAQREPDDQAVRHDWGVGGSISEAAPHTGAGTGASPSSGSSSSHVATK